MLAKRISPILRPEISFYAYRSYEYSFVILSLKYNAVPRPQPERAFLNTSIFSSASS